MRRGVYVLVIIVSAGVATMLWGPDISASAPPPECTSTPAETVKVVDSLSTWPPFKPLSHWQVVNSTLSACDGPKSSQRLELVLKTVVKKRSFHAPLFLWVSARKSVPENSPSNRQRISALARSLEGVLAVTTSHSTMAQWLAAHPSAVGEVQPKTDAQPICVRFVAPASDGNVPRFRWCADVGVREYTVSRWDTVKDPIVQRLAKQIAISMPQYQLKHASFDHFTGTWRAEIVLTHSVNKATLRVMRRLDAGSWRNVP